MTDIEVGKLYVRYDFEELKFIIPLSSEIVVVYESDCFKFKKSPTDSFQRRLPLFCKFFI